jgi:uncharacterized protein YbjT (DUF2867 family)
MTIDTTSSGRGSVLVTAGTGKTGRRVVERLRRLDVPVRAGSRSGATRFDWEDATTWRPALEGASAAYITYFPDLAVAGAPDAITAFADLAADVGTRRLVLLSGRGEEEAQACEKVLANSSTDWTVLRCSWFDQNFDESYLLEPIVAGEVVLPAGEVGEPFIDADDIAEVAVAVLTQDGHTGQIYEMTGPRLLTFPEAVAAIGEATGRHIAFRQIPTDDFAAAMAAEHAPADVVELLLYLFATVLDGRNEHLGDGVQRVLGRPPRDFTEYARDVAATGVWNPRVRA